MARTRVTRHGSHTFWRTLRATLLDGWVILHETGWALIAFVVIWLAFGLAIWRWDRSGSRPALANALYTALAQLLFQPQALPQHPALQVMFFLAPAVGLTLVASGALQAAVLMFDKRTRREAWQMALAATYSNHIIVCGLGKVGYRVVGQLQSTGHDVVVIQRDITAEFYDLVVGMGIPVIVGDGRQPDILLQAGLQRAHSLTIVTNDDLTNLDIALTARELRPNIQIVMRVFHDALARKLSSAFNIKTAFSTSALAAPTFAAAAINREVDNAIYVADQLLVTHELMVRPGGRLEGQTIAEIGQRYDVSVLHREHNGQRDLHPRPDERLTAGDRIVVIGVLQNITQLTTMTTPISN